MAKANKVPKDKKGDSITVRLGEVAVDSGQLMLCDPCYVDSEWRHSKDFPETHTVYRRASDGTLWQYRYKRDHGKTVDGEVINPFPGNYAEEVPGTGMSANDAIANGLLLVTDLREHGSITLRGSFSGPGISSSMHHGVVESAQLNFRLGHPGAGVAFRTAHGDGTYGVYADCTYDGSHWVPDRVWVGLTGMYGLTYSTPQDGITRFKQMLVLKLENLVKGKERTAMGKAAKAVADLIEGSKVKVPRG